MAMEYHNFWPSLLEQRTDYITNQPAYQYQLEQQSIFPLKYELVNNRDNPLARLIKVHGFHDHPTKYMTLLDLNSQLNMMAHHMPDNQHVPDSQNTAIAAIAKITGWPERKLNKHNSYTFLPLITATIKPPTFSEAWAAVLPSCELPPPQPAPTATDRVVKTAPRRRAVPHIQQQAQPVPVIRSVGIILPATPVTGISAVYCETPDYNTPIPVRNTEPPLRAASRKKLFDISNTPHINTPTTDTWCTPLWETPQFNQEPDCNKENIVTWNLNFDE